MNSGRRRPDVGAAIRGPQGQRGQILVIVAGGLLALIALAALVLEGGTLILNRRDAQNTADLAAVSGTSVVAKKYTNEAPFDSADPVQSDVYEAIGDSAALNGCGASGGVPCNWTARFVGSGLGDLGPVEDNDAGIPSGALGVQVGVTRQPSAIMGRVVGFSTWDVTTEGTAIAATPKSLPGGILLPIAVCGWGDIDDDGRLVCAEARADPDNRAPYGEDNIVDLTIGKTSPGGFAWLSWYGENDTGTLAKSLCGANNPPFELDDIFDEQYPKAAKFGPFGTNPTTKETWFPSGPGKMNAAETRGCLEKWIGQEILVPVYDIVDGTGDSVQYHITGVAAFTLVSYSQPAVDNIRGFFVDYYALPAVPGGADWQPPAPGDTTYFLGLVR